MLFGRNVASYKCALAKSLLEIASQGHEAVALADLGVVYREVVDAACGWAVYGGVVSVMVVSM
ncbi:MAG: hypothetical protein MAG471_01798 [Acidimicrobiaceae bacterium]|nr:hypothetical protein [Acidimicrobiaceae bacterium]